MSRLATFALYAWFLVPLFTGVLVSGACIAYVLGVHVGFGAVVYLGLWLLTLVLLHRATREEGEDGR